jgi:flagellar biosynthesis protein FliR
MLSILANNLGMSVESIEIFSLVLVRTSAMIFILPFLSISGVIPTTVKAGLSFFIALIAFPMLPPAGFVIQNSPVFFFLLVLEQVMIGLIIGFTATYLFHFVVIGGHIISRDIGISMGGTMDPIQDETGDELGVLLLLIFSIAFLVKGFHHYFIQVILESFQMIPIGHFNWDFLPVVRTLVLLSSLALVTGVKLAAPIIVALLLVSLGMALMARVMPEMNVWVVAVPLKIVLGILILWECFPLMTQLFDWNFEQVQSALVHLLKSGGVHG